MAALETEGIMTNEELFATTTVKARAAVFSRVDSMFSLLRSQELHATIGPATTVPVTFPGT